MQSRERPRLAPGSRGLRTSSDHKGLTLQIKGGNRERQPPLTLSHELSLIRGRVTTHQVQGEDQEGCVSAVVPVGEALGSALTGGYLGGQGGRTNFSKVQRLQGSRLRGRFYKYLPNKTLPVNW